MWRIENRHGGCAYTAAHMLKHISIPHILRPPSGTGEYGELVLNRCLKKKMAAVTALLKKAAGATFVPAWKRSSRVRPCFA
jgi:hypothetical protein